MEGNMGFTNKQKALSIYKWTIRKYLPFSIAYWILLGITFPIVEIFVMIVNSGTSPFSYYVNEMKEAIKYLPSTAFSAVAILFSIILTIIAFSYMHNKRSIDFFGSFPVSRRTLFFARYFAVVTSCVVPIIVFGLIGAVLGLSDTAFLTALQIIGILIVAVIGNISFLAFISLCCGTAADVIVSYGIINMVYPICIVVCYYFPSTVIPGLDSTNLPAAVYTMLCPAAASFTACFGTGRTMNIVWWIVFSIALMAGCFRLCKKRKAETAQNAFASSAVEIVIKFITCFTAGMGFGWVLSFAGESTNSVKAQYIWFAVGFVTADMIANVLLHLIFHRGLSKYKKSLVECGAVLTTGAVFVLIVVTGALGYDVRMPDRDDIKEVSVKLEDSQSFVIDGKDVLAKYTSDPEAIDMLLNLHNKIVEREKKVLKYHGLYSITGYNDYARGTSEITIFYKLKNGRTMTRYYHGYVCNVKDYDKDIERLKGKDLYADSKALINSIPEKYIDYIQIGITRDKEDWEAYYSMDVVDVENNKGAIQQMVEALKKDISEKGILELPEDKSAYVANIEYNKYGEWATCYLVIPDEYTNTIKFLKSTEYGNIVWQEAKNYGSYIDDMSKINYTLSGRTIYFEVPEEWNNNLSIRCMLRVEYEDEYGDEYTENLFQFSDKISQCEQVSDRVWKYTIPEIQDKDYSQIKVSEIMFYQYSNTEFNYSGCINIDEDNKKSFLKLINIEDIDTGHQYEWLNPVYEYEWTEYKEK